MKEKISFSDLSMKYRENSTKLEEINKLNIDYKSIIDSKKTMIDNYEKIIASINPKNIKDFEMQSKEYMERIASLEEEIRSDEEKAGRKEKLINENKKIVEQARERKEKLEKQVLEEYEKGKKEEEKNVSKDIKEAKKELDNYKEQLTKLEEDEINYPNKVKNSEYKQFLKNKIKEKQDFINSNSKESAEEIKDFLLKEIKEEYLAFKKGIAKEYMPEESKNPNPVLEKAKKAREVKASEEVEKKRQKIINDNDELENVEIIVGRKGKIVYNGKTYNIPTKTIKESVYMDSDEVIELLEENNLKVSKELEEYIKDGIQANTINQSVLAMISSADGMTEKDKITLLKTHLLDGIKAAKNLEPEKTKNSLNLTYDQEDLSKVSLLRRIFRREMNESEKYEILKKAKVAERYGIAKTTGIYKLNRKAKFINGIFRNKVEELPSADEIYEVANAFNKARDSKDFKNTLKEETKEFSPAQVKEMNELWKSQEKQETEETR